MKTGDYIDHNGYRYELQYIGVRNGDGYIVNRNHPIHITDHESSYVGTVSIFEVNSVLDTIHYIPVVRCIAQLRE